jgi:NAD(P)-dependent dehydrogenase (short-subunit alcohol dehydrogenase family)
MSRNFTDLAGRVAVVIGGTSGLGRAIAIALAEAGADVVPTGRRREHMRQVGDEIQALGRRTLLHDVDVSDRASIDALRDEVMKQFGRIDILVNAAGRTSRAPVIEVRERDWMDVLDINLTGLLRSCQSFHQPLRESGRGRIINLASLASSQGWYGVAAYNASKAGVVSMTQTLAIEWAGDQINVNALVPGVFPTDINAQVLDGTDRGREILLRTPMHRFGRPEELAPAAVFLASDAASFITGSCLVVDGGFLASGVSS